MGVGKKISEFLFDLEVHSKFACKVITIPGQ